MQVEKYSEQKRYRTTNFEVNVALDFFNKRLRLDDYRGNVQMVIDEMITHANKHKFEKLIVKSRKEHMQYFIENGFTLEGIIYGYFLGSDAYFMTKYLTNERRNSSDWMKEEKILSDVKIHNHDNSTVKQTNNYLIRKAETSDYIQLSSFYSQIFKIYPTPLNQPSYIEKVMNDGTCFYLIEDNGVIISAASAEINDEYKNAELTDCATLPSYRKAGLMKVLLELLEKELISRGVYCSYSIARSLSFGMNACFQQLGYTYTGRLVNNCYIYDKLEDMNIWVKDLSKANAE